MKVSPVPTLSLFHHPSHIAISNLLKLSTTVLQSQFNMSSSNLKCSLIKSLPDSSVEDTVGILSSNGRGYDLKISFRRTIRVPDNTYASELPLGLGKFPLYSATKYKANLPEDMGIKEDFSSQCTVSPLGRLRISLSNT